MLKDAKDLEEYPQKIKDASLGIENLQKVLNLDKIKFEPKKETKILWDIMDKHLNYLSQLEQKKE